MDSGVLHFAKLDAPLGICLLGCGWADLSPATWAWRRLVKPFWALYLNDRDGAAIISDGIATSLRAGRACIVPAWVQHQARCTAPGIRHLYLFFDVLGLPATVRPRQPLDLPAGTDLAWLAAIAARPGSRLGLGEQGRITRLILDGIAPCLEAPPPAGDPLLDPLLAWLDGACQRSLNLAEMAARCGLSENAFGRRFRVLTGSTPIQYLRDLRLQRACHQLVASHASTARIAAACGFGNRTYFARVFRRSIGLTPNEFRQENRRAHGSGAKAAD